MKTKDPAKELTKLQDQIAEVITNCDLSSSAKAIAETSNISANWLEAKVKNMQLKQRSLKNTLQQYLKIGEQLVEEYEKKYGRDCRIAIQEQVILEPVRIKLQELDRQLSDLQTLRKTIKSIKEQDIKIQTIALQNLIGGDK